jgi:hypothetical protein
MFVWNAGDGGHEYAVEVRRGFTSDTGHREAIGAIAVTAGALYLSSYTAITMAAQYADEPLPARSEVEQRITLDNGDYSVRLLQMFDPNDITSPIDESPHFILEFENGFRGLTQNVSWFPRE